MIRCCEDNRRSDGGRRPQRRLTLPAGRQAWRSCWAGSRAGSAGWSHAGGPGRSCLGCWRTCHARTAGRSPSRPATPAPTACSTCWAGPFGTPTRSATTSGPTSSSTSATPTPCWSSTRPASSRRAPARSGCSASTPAPPAGSRTPRSASSWPTPPAGHGVIDRELYLPKDWTDDPDRCQAAGIPDQVGFATKPALAKAMLARALDAGVPAAWVTGDEVYGGDPGLRAELEARGIGYVLAVACDHRSGPAAPPSVPTPCSGASRRGPGSACRAGKGAKGHRYYDWAFLRLDHGDPAPAARQASTGSWSAATSEPASWPSTAAGHPARSRWPPWYGSPGAAGPSRSASRPARAWSAWTSTRSAAGAPGTAGSPWPCSPTPSWSWRP